MNCKVYERNIDAGHGVQILVFVDGKCISQAIKPKFNGCYTGDGNPEFLDKSPRQIGMKANGFKRWSNRADEIDHAIAMLTSMYVYEAQLAENEAQLKEYGMA